ncbi:NUDIX hydrolase [Bacillus sp. AK031]
MRNRGSVVIIDNKQVVLIKRVRDGEVYYVYPGGGIEAGETPEETARREAFEELGVTVELEDCIAVIDYHGKQYFYLAYILNGQMGTGSGEEFLDTSRGTYEPLWMDIDQLPSLDVRPGEVSERVLSLNIHL